MVEANGDGCMVVNGCSRSSPRSSRCVGESFHLRNTMRLRPDLSNTSTLRENLLERMMMGWHDRQEAV